MASTMGVKGLNCFLKFASNSPTVCV